MGRYGLRFTFVLGLLITSLGGTGIFAVFTDRATGGEDAVTSAVRDHAADVRIARAWLANPENPGWQGIGCDPDVSGTPFADDVLTGQFFISGAHPGMNVEPFTYVCLENAGAVPATLTARLADITDLDVACTGDEAAAGDATCGGSQAGELSALVRTVVHRVLCVDPQNFLTFNQPAPLTTDAGWDLTTSLEWFSPGTVACAAISLSYFGAESAWQLGQSDQVTWRYAFDAQAIE